MPRAWLLPIRRLQRLAGRELATGCRSRRDSSLPEAACCCKTCWSDSPEDSVGCPSPFMKAIALLKVRDSSLAEATCYCKTCWSDSPEDTVGCPSPFMKALTLLKEGLTALKDCTSALMYAQEIPWSEINKYTVSLASQVPDAVVDYNLLNGQWHIVQQQNMLHEQRALYGISFAANMVRQSSDEAEFSNDDIVGCSWNEFSEYCACEYEVPSVNYRPDLFRAAVSKNLPIVARRCFSSSSGPLQKSIVFGSEGILVAPAVNYRPYLFRAAVLKNLPFVARRCYNSSSDPQQNSTVFGSGDKILFEDKLKCATTELKSKLDIPDKPNMPSYNALKAEFASDFRPVFVLNGLMLPDKLEHYSTAYLHGPVHGLTKKWPLYLSSLDIMIYAKICRKEHMPSLIDYIVERRIMIADDWENTYGNIEMLSYDPSYTSFVRGECDAAFEKISDEHGIAAICFLIWKGRELVYGNIIEGLQCTDSCGAEVQAALALLLQCKEMGFEKIELWTDSKRVCGVIAGFESIPVNDKNREYCLVLRSMQTQFRDLVPMFRPREIMFLTNEVLKLEGTIKERIEKGIKKWSEELQGKFVFNILNTKWTANVVKTFAKLRKGNIHKQDYVFYWKVEKGQKFAAFLKIRQVFCPEILHLALHKFQEKPANLRWMIAGSFLADNVASSGSVTTFTNIVTKGGESHKRPLVVVWDSSLHKEHFEQDECIIILIEEEEELVLMKSAQIKEINVSTYLYFNRAEFKEEKEKENGKSTTEVDRSTKGRK